MTTMKSLNLLSFLCCVSLCLSMGILQKRDLEKIDINYAKENDTGDICSLPLEIGVCRALFYRYGFDNSVKECRKFMYGGCPGNANNFRTLEECERVCLRK